MAATNDLMYEKLSVYFGVTDESLGDLMSRLRDEDPSFQGGARKQWYKDKLDGLVVAYDANAHLADLANTFWSLEDPFAEFEPPVVDGALQLENSDFVLLENGDYRLLG